MMGDIPWTVYVQRADTREVLEQWWTGPGAPPVPRVGDGVVVDGDEWRVVHVCWRPARGDVDVEVERPAPPPAPPSGTFDPG